MVSYKFLEVFLFSLITSLAFFPFFIKIMKEKVAPIRDFFSSEHVKEKQNTPSMGGILMLFVYLISIFLFCNLQNPFVWVIIFASVSFGFVGFFDDYLKITKKNHFTITTRNKLKIQFFLASLTVLFVSLIEKKTNGIFFLSFLNIIPIKIGFLYYILRVFVITGGINGVNLTDGLDGLVSIPAVLNLIFFSIVGYFFVFKIEVLTFKNFYNKNYEDIIICCLSLIGIILGFLKYNYKPAKIFMGDVGSVFIGINLATFSILLKQEFLFFICGMLFVFETLTSFIQIYSIRTGRGKVFKMCPIHHHFEFYGWKEKKIVFLFWAFSVVFFLISILIFIKSYTTLI